jgi:hypothetical protein
MKRKTKRVAKADSHLYLGETDPARYIHQNKTHRTASEAFRDADYATAIWRCETDWDRSVEYIKVTLGFVLAGVVTYLFCEGFISWLVS